MNSLMFCTVGRWLHTVSDNPSLLSTQIPYILSTTCPSSPHMPIQSPHAHPVPTCPSSPHTPIQSLATFHPNFSQDAVHHNLIILSQDAVRHNLINLSQDAVHHNLINLSQDAVHHNLINPFTAQAWTISGLKDAGTCLQTVYFPVL